MIINCPYCGERENSEFTIMGDARLRERPNPAHADAARAFHDYVHLRDNPAGLHRELWYHEGGCRAWLIVTRDTVTHAVHAAEPALGDRR
ncbi:MAG: sarcosine oxidase subunit delta [Pseudomonadota bacterium]